MKWGDFRELFRGIAWKRLTPHEVDATVSNGHEFQGVAKLREVLGTEASERLPATYVLLRDDQDDLEVIRSTAKWYNSRENHPERSPEWRLYYPAEAGQIQAQMHAGDLMVIAVTRERSLVILMAPQGSGREGELLTLFRLDLENDHTLNVRSFDDPIEVDFVAATLLESLGLSPPEPPTGGDAMIVNRLVDELVSEHADALPPGKTVAALIREWIPVANATADPDMSLMRWIEAEAAMYRAWEDAKIARRINDGFRLETGAPDVEGFRNFSMSLRQSRVSRAGGALQYHFRALLDGRRISYVMEPVVDGGERPDFLFPGLTQYEDARFPPERLRMLAAKFTAKDRWRQVLNEARRIQGKHLLTLEPGISRTQMALMSAASLTLVMPNAVRSRYGDVHRASILTVGAFLDEVSSLT